MDRRTALQHVGASALCALTGCTHPPGATTETATRATPDVQRRVSVKDGGSVPEQHQIEIGVTVLEPTITESHTARLRLTVTNTGPARAIPVSTGRCALLNRYSQASSPRGVWLGLADEAIYRSQTGPKWVADPPDDGAFPDYSCSLRPYAAGESVSTEYVVLDDSRSRGYLDAGTYRFTEDVYIAPDQSADPDADGAVTVDWGFTLRIENPNCTICL